MDIIKKRTFRPSHSYAILFFLIFWLLLFICAGTLFSGFHLTDDHEIMTIRETLSHQSFLAAAYEIIQKDLTIRFRPFYYFMRTIEAAILGEHFYLWSIYKCLLGVIVSFFLYLFCRLLNFTYGQSILFTLLTLIGPQASIWWRLAPAETTGMVMLSIALVCMAILISNPPKTYLYNMLFLFFLLCASLTKETFLITMPAWLFCLPMLSHLGGYSSTFGAALKRNIVLIVIGSLAFFSGFLFVYLHLGSNSIGYAGIDQHTGMKDYIKTLLSYLLTSSFWIVLFGFYTLLIGEIERNQKINVKSFAYMIDLVWIFFFSALLLFPQIVLYAKSGFFGRYYLPAALSLSIPAIWIYRMVCDRCKHSAPILLGVILLYLFISGYLYAVKPAMAFAQEGRNTQELFHYLKSEAKAGDAILIASNKGDAHEWAVSSYVYLKSLGGMNRLFTALVDANREMTLREGAFESPSIVSNDIDRRDNSFRFILIIPGAEEDFIAAVKDYIDLSTYRRKVFLIRDPNVYFVLYYR
ncbi:MAG: hypothetical protein AB1656_06835 [Candidatus Omnitrophota bacterium]